MKRVKLLNRLFCLVLIAILATGCASKKDKEKNSNPPQVGDEYIPPGVGPGLGPGGNFQYGGTADMMPVSLSVFEAYTNRIMFNPTNVRINVNLTEIDENIFGGHVTLDYDDADGHHTGYFTSMDKPQKGTVNGDTNVNIHNRWFFHNDDKLVWHGFFEDYFGGLVVVIDDVRDLGDGQGPEDSVGGSIWFKNFRATTAYVSPTNCWFVKIGPFECQAWLGNGPGGIDTTKGITPDNGYIKLGDFTDLSLIEAFNGEL